MLQQFRSRLRHTSAPPCSSVGPCQNPARTPRALIRSVRSACPVPQRPPPKLVVHAGRRGRPSQPEQPGPELPDDDPLIENDQFAYDEDEDAEYAEELDPMSKRLIGLDAEDEDEGGEFSAPDEFEDEGDLEEAAEADRDGAAADDVGEPSTSYPEPPLRVHLASDLFGKAAVFDTALWLAAHYPELAVTGVQSNPALVCPGDVFVLHPWQLPVGMGEQEAIFTAVEQGAHVVVAPFELGQEVTRADSLTGRMPEEVPLVRVDDTTEIGARLARACYDAPSSKMITIGVTGHVGKTTTSWLIRGILEELGHTVGLMSSIEHAIAEDRLNEDGYLWEPDEEDPSAERESSVPFKLIPYAGKYMQLYGDDLPGTNAQRMLAGMCDRGAQLAVLEMGQQHLSRGTFDLVDVNVAVVTNLTPGAAAGSKQPQQPQGAEAVASALEASNLMISSVASKLRDAQKQVLVLNADEPRADDLLRQLGGSVPVVTFGVANSQVDVWAESIKYNIWETEVIVYLRNTNQRLQIITNLLGRHNVYNVLAAVATGVALKAPVTSIVAGVEAVEIPGRSEVIDEGQQFSVVVDAARSPESLAAMLDAARQAGARQIFTVFGCSGGEDPTLRPRMGAVAHAKSDYVIVTNENPRAEDPAQVVSDIVAGFPDDMINRYSAYAYFPFQDQGRTPLWFEPFLQKAQRDHKRYIMEDRYSAIRAAIGTAGPDDVVLLTGKGHEDWVVHRGEDGMPLVGWLDDRVEARNALSKLKYLEQSKINRDTLPWGTRIESLMESLQADVGALRMGAELGD